MQQQASVLRYRTSALRRVTWAIWPWLNWLLPIGFCLAALGTGRGVLPMLAVFASPLLVPAAGLLGALPRRMLRSQGVGAATPASITWLLVLHWWSWIGMAVTLPDDTFVEVRPSLLQRLLGQPLSETTPDLAIDHDAFAAVLTAADWTITRSGQTPLRIDARDAHGSSLTMAQQGDTPLQITVTTGSWWQSADLPVTAELGRAGGIGGGYASDEWPLLR